MNMNLAMEKEIQRLKASGKRERLLLNSCCGPCSTSVLKRLMEVFDVTVHFYNPNIDSEQEYLLRLENQKTVLEALEIPINQLLEAGWQKERWEPVGQVPWDEEGGQRCRACLAHRLEATAQLAAELGFDWFTSTLSVSPHKDAEYLSSLGEQLEIQYGVRYLPSDFKKQGGYQESVRLSKEWGLYRQDYCGCAVSKRMAETRKKQR